MPPHLVQSGLTLEQAVARPESARRPLAARGALTERLRAAARSVRQVRELRSELPERHSAPRCSGTVRYAAAAYPHLHLRAASSKAQFESAGQLRAAWAMPEAFVWRPREAVPVAQFGSAALLPAEWLTPEAIVLRPQGAAQFESAAQLPVGWAM